MNTYKQVWDLDVIFPGGSESSAFADFVAGLRRDLEEIEAGLAKWTSPKPGEEAAAVAELTGSMQAAVGKIREADSFISCLTAQDQDDRKALVWGGTLKVCNARLNTLLTHYDRLLTSVPEAEWESLLQREDFAPLAFPLSERRELAKEQMPPALEALANDLAVDGYHGWSELYDTAVSKVRVPFEKDGAESLLSAGQAANKLDDPDPAVRKTMAEAWEKAWSEQADFCAEALNHLGGFRLQLYKHRGWDNVLKEPLVINRMSEATLAAMWGAINSNRDTFGSYLERKAALLGKDKLGWFDVDAPIGDVAKRYTYEESAALITEQFRKFSPQMASLAERAFRERWIEAEDRPGKRPGGFCTSFPLKEQTRIFMTYSGSMDNMSTLAHELGHAFHQHVMNDLPQFRQGYAMNVAETASTLAEMIVFDAALKQAADERDRLAIAEDKVRRAVTFFMNIQARFLFERSFYEERKRGVVPVERLNELMIEAQKQAFNGALADYHPHFWASKLHFYITEVPFYNFPYTFGYLFSAGIYAGALRDPEQFESRYVALLRDTANMSVEELARKHLDADLTQQAFWQQGIDLMKQDLALFLELTSSAGSNFL